jgi:hypothetical protein
MPSIRKLHFVHGKRVIRSRYWEFWVRAEKICATANAVLLGQAEKNSPDERRGETRDRPPLSLTSLRWERHCRGSPWVRVSRGNPMNRKQILGAGIAGCAAT